MTGQELCCPVCQTRLLVVATHASWSEVLRSLFPAWTFLMVDELDGDDRAQALRSGYHADDRVPVMGRRGETVVRFPSFLRLGDIIDILRQTEHDLGLDQRSHAPHDGTRSMP